LEAIINENLKALKVLEQGIFAEVKASAFYNYITQKIENKDVRFLCRNLAQDEKLHRLMLEDRYTFLGEGKDCKVDDNIDFNNDPTVSSMTQKDLIKQAIDCEIKAQEFYLSKSKEMDDKKAKKVLLDLYNMEQEHEAKLKKLLETLD